MGSIAWAILAQAEESIDFSAEGGGTVALVLGLVMLGVVILFVAASWKVYSKAGQPGRGCLIPIYNIYLLCKMAGRPGWWLILYLIPLVNVIVAVVMMIDLAKAFGQGNGFGLGLAFLGITFWPALGSGGATYQGLQRA